MVANFVQQLISMSPSQIRDNGKTDAANELIQLGVVHLEGRTMKSGPSILAQPLLIAPQGDPEQIVEGLYPRHLFPELYEEVNE